MNAFVSKVTLAAVAFVLSLGSATAGAAPILVNGGFEAGLTGWSRLDQLGSDGTFFVQTGVASPVNGFPVPAPPEGVQAAMSDAMGPGSHVLYQDFVVPAVLADATLSYSLFVNNGAFDFFTPATLDFSMVLNQRARVDIMLAAEDPFSMNVLLNLFETAPGDPLVSGYTTHTHDLTAFLAARAGQTLRLRFAEVDNVFFLNMGVDAVNLDVNARQAPEPATLLLLATGIAMAARRRRA
jgi:hypothetical protein